MLAQLLVVFFAKVTSAPWLTCSGPSYVLGRDYSSNSQLLLLRKARLLYLMKKMTNSYIVKYYDNLK